MMTDEEAKAVQEVANTAGKAIDATERFSNFLERVFGKSMQDIGEVVQFKTQYWKLQNAIKFAEKVDKLLEEKGSENLLYVNPRVGIPLIEAAANEDVDELQDLWAQLMASTVSGEGGLLTAQRSYIETVRQFEQTDAQNLTALISVYFSVATKENKVWMKVGKFKELPIVWRSMRNLERLGLIELSKPDAPRFSGKSLEDGEIELFVVEQEEDSNAVKRDGIQLHMLVRFTTFGFGLSRAVTGYGYKYTTDDGQAGEYIPIDWDEFFEASTKVQNKN